MTTSFAARFDAEQKQDLDEIKPRKRRRIMRKFTIDRLDLVGPNGACVPIWRQDTIQCRVL